PDALRLRYRKQLSALIAAVVRSGATPNAAAIDARMPETIAAADRDRFITLVIDEFKNLHAGNAIRFGLRPLEFAAWKEAFTMEPRQNR
ncbi:MAG TPA: hypothetical protein V6D19_08225, partial [Stenomitos sp.]